MGERRDQTSFGRRIPCDDEEGEKSSTDSQELSCARRFVCHLLMPENNAGNGGREPRFILPTLRKHIAPINEGGVVTLGVPIAGNASSVLSSATAGLRNPGRNRDLTGVGNGTLQAVDQERLYVNQLAVRRRRNS